MLVFGYMYSVFPYGEKDITPAMAALNETRARDFKAAITEHEKRTIKVLNQIVPNHWLRSNLIDFIEKIIKEDFQTEIPGARIFSEIDSLYGSKAKLTLDETEALEKADLIANEDGTVTEDDIGNGTDLALEEQTRTEQFADQAKFSALVDNAKDKLTIQNLKPAARSFYKASLMKLFHDINRMRALSNPSNVKLEKLSGEDTSWNHAADSFVGSHTLGVNSDHYSLTRKKEGIRVLASLADGVSFVGRFEGIRDLKLYKGHHISKAVTDNISEFPLYDFLGSTHYDMVDQKLNDDETKVKEKFFECPWQTLQAIENNKEFASMHWMDNSYLDQYIEYLETEAEDQKLANVFKDSSVRKVLAAIAPLALKQKEIKKQLLNDYITVPGNLRFGSTLSYAIELEDEILTVKMGDSDIAAYDKEGKKLIANESFDLSNHNAPDPKFLTVKINRENNEVNMEPPMNFQVNVYNKNDVNQIAMISDGLAIDEERFLPDEISNKIQESFSGLVQRPRLLEDEKPDYDDETLVVLQKAA